MQPNPSPKASAQHTAGPWHWIDSTTDEPFRWDGGNEGYPSLRTVKQFGENKTEVRDGLSYTSFALPKFILHCDSLENPADARLIAAAPDLLDALRELLSAADEAWSPDRPCSKEARAALLKATEHAA